MTARKTASALLARLIIRRGMAQVVIGLFAISSPGIVAL